MSKGLLFDATLCINCKSCEQACAEQNKLPYDANIAAETVQSDHKYTVVLANKEDKFMRRLCQHCEDPACASACPVGAFEKTKLGPVVYDASKCMGCRYCMVACAYAVPKYEWGKLNPKVQKCIMCPDRVAAGKPTACAEACPTGATKFGDREELLNEAKARIAASPDKYIPHIYGETELGGSNVLLLSSVPFEQFGLPAPSTLPPNPLGDYTFRVQSKIPDFAPLWALMLGGVYWLNHRKEEVAQAEAKEREEKQKGGAR